MVAITALPTALPTAIARPTRRPRSSPGPARPALRLVPPAAGRTRPALGGLVAAVAVALVVAAAALYLVRAEPTPARGEIPVLESVHVVADGETMWSIADQVAPAGEAATYVERLVAVNGTASVSAGQQLTLPAP